MNGMDMEKMRMVRLKQVKMVVLNSEKHIV